MSLARGIALGAVLVMAGLVQVVVLSPVDWPGAVPDLLVPIVVGVALCAGPMGGALTGFLAGAVLDLAPPAGHPLGQWAFVLALLGYLAALFGDEHAGILRGVLLSAGAGALALVLKRLALGRKGLGAVFGAMAFGFVLRGVLLGIGLSQVVHGAPFAFVISFFAVYVLQQTVELTWVVQAKGAIAT